MPYSLLEKLKLILQELEEKDVIQKVDITTPWVNSLVIVEKRDGSLCLDPRDLKKAIRREHHRIPSAEDTHFYAVNGKCRFLRGSLSKNRPLNFA